MRKLLLLIVFLANISFLLKAQSKNTAENFNYSPKEKIFVHTNNNFLITGETLYYKIYCLDTDNNFSNFSKLAYIELLDSENTSLIKQKINLKNGTGNSDLFIKSGLKSGSYKLVAYTRWMTNEKKYFEENIYIVNPFETKINREKDKKNTIVLSEEKDASLILKNNKTYAKREQVIFPLKNKLKKGNYSISVSRQINSFIPKKHTSKSFLKTIYITKKDTAFNIPEIRGNIFSGEITPKKEGLKVSAIKIGVSTNSENPVTKTTITDEDGMFYILLEDLNTNKLNLQILDKERENYIITLNKEKKLNKEFDDFKELIIDKNTAQIISKKSLFIQIESAYNKVKKDSSFFTASKDIFHGKKLIYKLDDYKRFRTIKETIIEILNNAFYTEKEGQYHVHIRDNISQPDVTKPTLVVLDGYIIYNHNELFDFNPNRINQISIIKNKYIFGSEIYQGIIFIDTFKKDYIPKFNNEFSVLAPQPEKKYFKENYTHNKKDRIPDYRTQLYWNPNFNFANKNISFFTSDVTGDYEINIEGFTNNSEPVSLKYNFTVK